MIEEGKLPSGETLMIHPHYVHYTGEFVEDENPCLPVGILYAGSVLDSIGNTTVEYHDSQLHDLRERSDLGGFDSVGINVIGTQNIATAFSTYGLLKEGGVSPERIYLGGQGVEGLTAEEFSRIFPEANQVSRFALSMQPEYWNTSFGDQLDKLSREDLFTYLTKNESTLVFSQGCAFSCDFCGAQVGQRETFYNAESNLRDVVDRAKSLGISDLSFYCTSLDFFQDALRPQGNGDLEKRLKSIAQIKDSNGVGIRLRALVRADSYLKGADSGLVDLAKDAGFYQFGFGADGAADISLLKAIHKGDNRLETRLFRAFQHAEDRDISPEILYVFGIPEDTDETLDKTRDLCAELLEQFPTSVYRGFPAKNEIPGNANWKLPEFKLSEHYDRLMRDPSLFINLGFETLANSISHPDFKLRRKVNSRAVQMSQKAHELGRVQSFLTIPIMDTDGNELMDERSFDVFRDIVRNYAPELADELTLENLPDYREELNRRIPKDK